MERFDAGERELVLGLVEQAGLGSLPEQVRARYVEHYHRVLEERVGLRISRGLSPEQLEEIQYLQTKPNRYQLAWLEVHRPDYPRIVAQEARRLLSEITRAAPQLVMLENLANPNPPEPQAPSSQAPSSVSDDQARDAAAGEQERGEELGMLAPIDPILTGTFGTQLVRHSRGGAGRLLDLPGGVYALEIYPSSTNTITICQPVGDADFSLPGLARFVLGEHSRWLIGRIQREGSMLVVEHTLPTETLTADQLTHTIITIHMTACDLQDLLETIGAIHTNTND